MNKYTITVTSILDDASKTKVVKKNISVNCVIHIPNDIITEKKQYNVVYISSHITPLEYMYDNIKDSLCICTSTIDEKRITEIRNEVETLGAFALLTKVNPIDTKSSLPVFVVSKDDFIPDIPYFSATSMQAIIDLQQDDTLSNKKDVQESFGNYRSYAFSRNGISYLEAYHNTLSCIKSSNTNTDKLVTKVEQYLRRGCYHHSYQYNIGTLVALTVACMKDDEEQRKHKRKVIEITLRFLGGMDFEPFDYRGVEAYNEYLTAKGNSMDDSPHNILYKFLMSNVTFWGRKKDDPRIKGKCLFLLHTCGLLTRTCRNDWNLLWNTIDSDIFHNNDFFDKTTTGMNIKKDLHIFFQEDYHTLIEELLIQNTPLTFENVKREFLTSKKINSIQKYIYALDSQFFTPDSLKDTFRTVLRSEMNKPSTICQKLLLLDYYYLTISRSSSFDEQLFISDIIPDLISSESPKFLGLKECFKMASLSKNMFVSSYKKGRNSQMLDRKDYITIANTLMRDTIHAVYNSPDVLQDLPIPNKDSPAFYAALLDAIKLELKNQYDSRYHACSFHSRVIKNYQIFGGCFAPIISCDLFGCTLKKWSPQSMLEICRKDKMVIDACYTIVGNTEMKNLKHKLMEISTDWTKRFDSENVLAREMEHVQELMKSCTFDSLEKRSKILLPTTARIQLKLNEIGCQVLDVRIRRVKETLTTTINDQRYTLARVFAEYNCTDEYAQRVTSIISGRVTGKTMNSSYTLHDIKVYLSELELLPNLFYICAFFRQYPSILFNKSVDIAWRKNYLCGLISAVNEACNSIHACFGNNNSYNGVASAMKSFTTEKDIDKELAVLQNCSRLNITACTVTDFRLIKLLLDFSSPLQEFVQSFPRNELQLDDTDDAVEMMKSSVIAFYSIIDAKLTDCVTFFDQLCSLLCTEQNGEITNPPHTVSYMVKCHNINELKNAFSGLLPLTYVTYGLSIWQYVHDMEWIGHDGYQLFRATYQNISNAFKHYSALKELSFLESLEPVVRLFSEVGGYCKACTSLASLINKIQNSNDIQNCMQVPTIRNQIREVDGRMNAIQELFDLNVGDTVVATPSPNRTTDNELPTVEMKAVSSIVDVATSKHVSHLHRWLEYHSLPPSVADVLLTWGVRTVDDVFLILSSQYQANDEFRNEFISKLPLLDRMKLHDAAAASVSAAKSVTSSNDSSSIVSGLSTAFNLQLQHHDDDIEPSIGDIDSISISNST